MEFPSGIDFEHEGIDEECGVPLDGVEEAATDGRKSAYGGVDASAAGDMPNAAHLEWRYATVANREHATSTIYMSLTQNGCSDISRLWGALGWGLVYWPFRTRAHQRKEQRIVQTTKGATLNINAQAYETFMTDPDVTPEELAQREETIASLEYKKHLAKRSFEFSVKGLDTEMELQLFPLPETATFNSSRMAFFFNTLKRDHIELYGPIKDNLPPRRIRKPAKNRPVHLPQPPTPDTIVDHDTNLNLLRNNMRLMGLEDIFDEELDHYKSFNMPYHTYAIWTRIPNDVMLQIFKKAMTMESPNYEQARNEEAERILKLAKELGA